MRKFRIIALSVSGRGKKIFSSLDEVNEKQFPNDDRIDFLLRGGYMEEITDNDADEVVKLTDSKSDLDASLGKLLDPEGSEGDESPKDPEGKKAIDDISKPDLKDWLTKKGIEHKSSMNKPELYALYIKANA